MKTNTPKGIPVETQKEKEKKETYVNLKSKKR